MSIKSIKFESPQMEGVLRFVKAMTKSMVFDTDMEEKNWKKLRIRNNLFYELMPKQKSVKYSRLKIGRKGVLLATDKEQTQDFVILYLHGGGFVTGSAYVCKSYMSMLAKYGKCRVYAPEYSLAPEHPFPAGFNDCCVAYEEVARLNSNSKIVLLGESAGGNFALALAHKYKQQGQIACVIVHSPTVDFSGQVDHSINVNNDFIVKTGCLKPLLKMYVGDEDSSNPYISPICGDFKNFPPIYITCDKNETLYADSKALYEKCVEQNVETMMVEFEGGYHACAVSGTNTPETLKILEENIKFIKERIK